MIIIRFTRCLCRLQYIVSLLLTLIICTPITTVAVFVPDYAVAQRSTRTSQNATSDLVVAVHLSDAARSLQIVNNKTALEYLKLVNQELSTLPNSAAINEHIVAKIGSFEELTAIGKIGDITLEGEPTSIGINPNANLIYVSQSLDRPPYTVVTVIDGKTNSVVKHIDVMPSPQDVAVNPNTNMIYVTHLDSNVVSIIDGKTNSVVKSIATGLDPAGLAVNPNTNMIYVGNIDSNTLSIIDGKTNSVVKDVKNLSAAEIAVNPVTNIIYLGRTECLCIMNDKTSSVEKNITLPEINSISINENTNTIYITSFGNNTASIIDGKTNSVVKDVNLNSISTKIAVNPHNNLTYTILPQEHKIVVSDSKLSAFPSTNKTG